MAIFSTNHFDIFDYVLTLLLFAVGATVVDLLARHVRDCIMYALTMRCERKVVRFCDSRLTKLVTDHTFVDRSEERLCQTFGSKTCTGGNIVEDIWRSACSCCGNE